MSKLMIAMPSDKTPPLYDFFNDELNEKQRQKLLSLFALMLQAPVSVMREPYVKHFTLERYSSLYELRAKSKTLVRIIFTMTPDGDVLFLTPFVKQHRRDTMMEHPPRPCGKVWGTSPARAHGAGTLVCVDTIGAPAIISALLKIWRSVMPSAMRQVWEPAPIPSAM